jgi:hypothetical protein
MAALDLKTVMDALATACPTSAGTRKFGYPVGAVEPPAVIVGYPTTCEFDATFGRGSDRAVFPIWYVVGRVMEKASRDKLSAVITDMAAISSSIGGVHAPSIQTARVTDCTPESVIIGAETYIAARFDVEVYT